MDSLAFIFAAVVFCALFAAFCGYFLNHLSSNSRLGDRLCAFAAFFCLAASPFPGLLSCSLWPEFVSGLLFFLALVGGALLFMAWNFYRNSGRKFQIDDVATVLQTDPAEALDFIRSFVLRRNATVRLFGGAVFYCLACIGIFLLPGPEFCLDAPLSAVFCAALLLCSILLLCRVGICRECARSVLQYRRNIRQFLQGVRKLESSNAVVPRKEGRGELYVIVIGESQSRDQMHAYHGVLPNTPWLDSVKDRRGWHLFSNAYAAHTQTVFCIRQAFTDGRSITGTTFPDSQNIITSSRLAGMRTAWISNQTDLGRYSSTVTAFAHLADRVVFSEKFSDSRNLFQSAPPDEVLLPLLAEELEQGRCSGENQLIIVHLMGNHIPYLARLPENFDCRVWRGARHLGGLAANRPVAEQFSFYSCSIEYTDRVLASIAAMIEEQPERPSCLLYFSDHGDDISAEGAPHDYANFTWPMGRIPMFIRTSPEYEALYPERCLNLEANKDKIFTNDLVYDLYLGLAGLKSESYLERYDPSSGSYALDADSAVFAWGQKIAGDPLLHIPRNVAYSGNPPLGAHRCNSLFKLKQARQYGIRSFEVDLLYSASETREDLFVGHDPDCMAGGLCLEEYLECLGPDFDFLWLDTKNLHQQNADEIFARLCRLDKKYELRARVLVESRFAPALEIFAKHGWSTALFMVTDDLSRLVAAKDSAQIGAYLSGIIRQLKKHGLEGISYDLAYDHLVRGMLQFMPEGSKCNAWRPAWKYTDGDLISKVGHYPHVSRLLVGLDTLFDL